MARRNHDGMGAGAWLLLGATLAAACLVPKYRYQGTTNESSAGRAGQSGQAESSNAGQAGQTTGSAGQAGEATAGDSSQAGERQSAGGAPGTGGQPTNGGASSDGGTAFGGAVNDGGHLSTGGAILGPGGSTSALFEDACQSYAEAACEYGYQCSTTSYVDYYGPKEQCVHYAAKYCWNWFRLPHTNITSASLGALAAAYSTAAVSCTETPADVYPSGDIENGYACASYLQCRSGYCTATSTTCGVCGPLPTSSVPEKDVGEDCDVNRRANICVTGTHCVDDICTDLAYEGEDCDGSFLFSLTTGAQHICDLYASWLTTPAAYLSCGSNGKCTRVGGEDQPCIDVTECAPSCGSCALGNYCDTSTSTCKAVTLIENGGVCDTTGTDVSSRVACEHGLCRREEDADVDAHCYAYRQAGETCGGNEPMPCDDGLSCNDLNRCVWPTVPDPPTGCVE
jgi:hypothetical protein